MQTFPESLETENEESEEEKERRHAAGYARYPVEPGEFDGINAARAWREPYEPIGTTGKAATLLGRRFVLIEQNPDYVNVIRSEAETWLGEEARQILTINCASVEASDKLF